MKTKRFVRCVIWIIVICASADDIVLADFGDLLRTLHNPTPQYGDYFGISMAALGDNVVVGTSYAGEAYLFDGTNGTLLQTLRPGTSPGRYFGYAVAGVGGDILVGDYGAREGGYYNAGTAYLLDGTTASVLKRYTNPFPEERDAFGQSVACAGSNVLIGAPYDNTGANSAGAVYLMNKQTGELLRTFQSPAPFAYQEFGYSIATSEHYILIGAPNKDYGGTNGAVYLYDIVTGALIHEILQPPSAKPPNPDFGSSFGSSVALVGDKIIVGSPLAESGVTGAAYIYDAITGQLLHTLHEPNAAGDARFGEAVARFGNDVLVGAPKRNYTGAAYLFDAERGVLLHTFLDPTPGDPGRFGCSFAQVGQHILIGDYHDDTGDTGAGSAYLFDGIPEPATLSLVALGGLVLLRRWRSGASDRKHACGA